MACATIDTGEGRRHTRCASLACARVVKIEWDDGILSMVLLLGPATIGIVLAMFMPQMPHQPPIGLGVTIATLYGFGFVLFSVAQISDQHGTPAGARKKMAPEYLRLYRMGYAMMSTALFLTLVYIKATR